MHYVYVLTKTEVQERVCVRADLHVLNLLSS